MTKRKAAGASSDFKKIRRAKVGQKARAPANVPDTSFKSASIRVASSSTTTGTGDAAVTSSQAFLSGRGKSLEELLDKLRNHPAPAARLSAAKGLKDLVSRAAAATATAAASTTATATGPSSSSTSTWISSHLSVLLPAVARCALVDEDDDVRRCGLDVLRILVLQQLTPFNSSTSNTSSAAATLWRPFLPLLVAHITSALNSMDRNTRMDGARAVECLGGGIASGGGGDPQQQHLSAMSTSASSILPALVRLLKEQSYSMAAVRAEADAKARTVAGTSSKMTTAAGAGAGATSTTTARHGGSGGGATSKVAKRRHHDTMTVLRALSVVLRSVNTTRAAPVIGAGDYSSTRIDEACIANPTSIHIVTKARASATLDAAAAPNSSLHAQEPALIRNVADWTRLVRTRATETASSLSSTHSSSLPGIDVATDLLEGLRDLLMDGGLAAESIIEASSSSTSRIGTEYDDEVMDMAATLLPLAMPIVTNQHVNTSGPVETRIRKALTMILSSLVRALQALEPSSDRRDDDAGPGSTLTTRVCLAILAVVDSTLDLSTVKRLPSQDHAAALSNSTPSSPTDMAMTAVVEYTLNSMRRRRSDDDAAATNMHLPAQSLSAILRVLERLLGSDRPSAAVHKGRLLRELVTTFFASSPREAANSSDGDSRKASRERWERSAAVRRAVHLTHRIVFLPNRYQFKATCDDAARDRDWAAPIVLRCVPGLVVSWRADFPSDSHAALTLLHEVVRRSPPPTASTQPQGTDDVIEYVAEALAPILEPERRGEGTTSSSTFELYPEPLQRMVLGIFVLTERLPAHAVQALGKLCSKSHLDQSQSALKPRMAEAVMEAVHSIRRRLTMRDYLGFVMQATGALDIQQSGPAECQSASEAKTGLPKQLALQLDRSLQVACRLLIECGPARKVLSMLWPFLLTCLTAPEARHSRDDLIQTRTAITLVAYISQFSTDGCLFPDELEVLSESLARFFDLAFTAANEDDPYFEPFIRPGVALLSVQRPELLSDVFRAALLPNQVGITSRVSSFQSLCYLVRSDELQRVIGNCATELIELTQSCGLAAPTPSAANEDAAERSAGPDQIWFHRLQEDLESAHSRCQSSPTQ